MIASSRALQFWIFSLISCVLGFATAQEISKPSAVLKVIQADPQAIRVSDTAVRQWVAGQFKLPQGSLETPDQQFAQLLRNNVLSSQTPRGSSVNYELRKATFATNNRANFKYPLSTDVLDDSALVVAVTKVGTTWQVQSVQITTDIELIPSEIFSSIGAWFFVVLTGLLAYGVLAKTIWRTWMLESWTTMRVFWKVFVWTNLLFFGLFVLGCAVAFSYPITVGVARELAANALSQGGLGGLGTSSVPSAAFAVAFNNLRAGIMFSSFIPGSLFAIPAYLAWIAQSFTYGFILTPFGQPALAFVLHIPTIILEFMAYFYVVSASGVMLIQIVHSKLSFMLAWRNYYKCLPVALTILILAAWYEAFELLVLFPLLLK